MDEKNTPPDPAPRRSLFGISIRVKRATPPQEAPEPGLNVPSQMPDAPRTEPPELWADLPPEKTVLQALETSLPPVSDPTREPEPPIAVVAAPESEALAVVESELDQATAPEFVAPAPGAVASVIELPIAREPEAPAPEAVAPVIDLPAAPEPEAAAFEVVAPVIELPDAAPFESSANDPEAEGTPLPALRSRPRISWRARPTTPRETPLEADALGSTRANPPAGWLSKDRLASLLLILAIVIGGALRLTDLNWDDGKGYHPDERFITGVTTALKFPETLKQFIDPRQSNFNPYNDDRKQPRNFAYGSFPLYATKTVQQVMSAFDKKWLDYDRTALVGRALSAIFDTGAILFVFLLARRLFNRRAALIAAFLYALSVLSIQHAHFYTSDITLNFFILLTAYAATDIVRRGDIRSGALTGAAAAIAVACKISAAPLLLLIPVALFLRWRGVRLRADDPAAPRVEGDRILGVGAAAVVAFLALTFICQPYAVLDAASLFRSIEEQNNIIVTGEADLPYTRQYQGTAPYVYFLQQLVVWGLGVPYGVVALAGWAFLIYLALRKRSVGAILLLAWLIPYFAITGRSQAKFLRYMLPLLPFLAIGAAVLSDHIRGWLGALAKRLSLPSGGAVSAALTFGFPALLVGMTALYALAFANIYTEPHTANQASKWINANVPGGSGITREHWEEGIAGLNQTYRQPPAVPDLPMYEADNTQKADLLGRALAQSDYIVFFSNRLYGTVGRLAQRYPLSREYYRLLFSGELGYELAYYADAPIQLGPIALYEDTFGRPGLPRPGALADYRPAPLTLNLGFADESFSAYDHPLTMVFKKTRPITAEAVAAALRPLAVSPQAAQAGRAQSLLTDAQKVANESGGTFSDLFNPNALPNQAPLLVWFVLMLTLGLAMFPITALVFRRLADRGYAFSRALGMVFLSWVVWFPVSLKLFESTRLAAFGALVAIVALGALVWRWRAAELMAFIRAKWRVLLTEELIFWAIFAAFVFVRASNPDLWHPARGGEKPMDFAYLLAAIKTSTLPPYDPWFAGGYINYYYYGQFMLAVLIKLSGILPEMAYNLVVPMLFAMTAAGMWGLAYNVISAIRGGDKSARLPSPAFGATLSMLFMSAFGNLDGGLILFRRLIVLGGGQDAPQGVLFTSLNDIPRLFTGMLKGIEGGQKVMQLPTDWFWAPTRVYPPSASIQEFPFFTFLFADLHAHMIAMPIAIVALGFGLALALGRPTPTDANQGRRLGRIWPWLRPAATVLLAALVLGAIGPTNSWDYPTYVLATLGAALYGWWNAEKPLEARAAGRGSATLPGLGRALVVGGAIIALSYAVYLPFFNALQRSDLGFDPQPERTPFNLFLLVQGFFLFAILSWLLVEIRRWFGANVAARMRHGAAGRQTSASEALSAALAEAGLPFNRILALGLLMCALALLLLALGWGQVAVFSTLCAIPVIAMALTRRPGAQGFTLLCAGLGLVLCAAVEVWVLKGDVGRMNTVFKYYLNVWTLFSLAAGVGLASLLAGLFGRIRLRVSILGIVAEGALAQSRPAAEKTTAERANRDRPGVIGIAWLAGLVLLGIMAAVYPFFALPGRLIDRFDTKIAPTLDGMKYMETARLPVETVRDGRRVQGEIRLSDDLAAIRWLRDNIVGSPVVLEATSAADPHPRLYAWGNRVAIYTGLPTLIGWDNHQRQQRNGSPLIEQRTGDVLKIFVTASEADTLRLLQQYSVDFIYYGNLEKFHYPAGEAKFAALAAQGALTPVYNQQGTLIYQVNAPAGAQ
ncbi:MAG TPA: DUF2298 domain-containing protein [Thermoflexales bacterium]|nr:DUF2298 domain-containing protein [Thermoflexales bacterium]